MTLKSYLWGMRIGTIVSLVSWVIVLNFVDPGKSGVAGYLFFYLSLFLVLAGAFTLFFTWLWRIWGQGDIAVVYLGASFRQGVLLALLAIVLILLQYYQILTWWDGALVISGTFLIELYFLTRR